MTNSSKFFRPSHRVQKLESEWVQTDVESIAPLLTIMVGVMGLFCGTQSGDLSDIIFHPTLPVTLLFLLGTITVIFTKSTKLNSLRNYLMIAVATSAMATTHFYGIKISEPYYIFITEVFLFSLCFFLPLKKSIFIGPTIGALCLGISQHLTEYSPLLEQATLVTTMISLGLNLSRYRRLLKSSMLINIVENAIYPIFCATKEGNVIYSNESAKALALIPETARPGFVPKTIERTLIKFRHKRTTLKTEHGINGRIFQVKVPLMTGEDYLAFYLTDITETKSSQLALEEERLKTFDAARFKSLQIMASGVAHEINNPLAIIQGAASILNKNILSESIPIDKAVKMIETIIITTQRIATIIDLLKDFSVSGNHIPYFNENTENVINSALDLTRARIEANGIQLKLKADEDVFIFCQKPKVAQALLAIIENAITAVRALERNAPDRKKEIQIVVKRARDKVQIVIKDNGIGIEQAVITKIMMPFFTTLPPDKGTGLGLAIAKANIEAQGGTLNIESHFNKGTTVIITLNAYKIKGSAA